MKNTPSWIKAIMVILIALAWIGAILSFVLPLVFTWRAFAGGWIPIWGNVNGSIILGLLWLFIIFPITSWLIIALCNTVVATLGAILEMVSRKYSAAESTNPASIDRLTETESK